MATATPAGCENIWPPVWSRDHTSRWVRCGAMRQCGLAPWLAGGGLSRARPTPRSTARPAVSLLFNSARQCSTRHIIFIFAWRRADIPAIISLESGVSRPRPAPPRPTPPMPMSAAASPGKPRQAVSRSHRAPFRQKAFSIFQAASGEGGGGDIGRLARKVRSDAVGRMRRPGSLVARTGPAWSGGVRRGPMRPGLDSSDTRSWKQPPASGPASLPPGGLGSAGQGRKQRGPGVEKWKLSDQGGPGRGEGRAQRRAAPATRRFYASRASDKSCRTRAPRGAGSESVLDRPRPPRLERADRGTNFTQFSPTTSASQRNDDHASRLGRRPAEPAELAA